MEKPGTNTTSSSSGLERSTVSESSENPTLTSLLLPDQWDLYLYDKKVFKKMAIKQNFQAEPYKKVCAITTVNDLIYILQLMKILVPQSNNSENKNVFGSPLRSNEDLTKSGSSDTRSDTRSKSKILNINLDMNDYIIMRKGIEPIWEDPRNKYSGTFSIKVHHTKGYDIWSTFMLYLLGETLTKDKSKINGISVSYISSDSNIFNADNPGTKDCFTFLKIWDGKPHRLPNEFIDILPQEILEKIKNESVKYAINDQKKDFNESGIIPKINKNKQYEESRPSRGGFRPDNKNKSDYGRRDGQNQNQNFGNRGGRGRGSGYNSNSNSNSNRRSGFNF